MKTPRQFPAQSPPVETGPVRFGNDDVGLFIRGAEAQMYPTALRLAASYLRCAKYWGHAEMLDMLAQHIAATVENGASSEPESKS
ncbi:MAG: hypothetical protein WAU60_06885 [Candidatus Competibacter denitrificans]